MSPAAKKGATAPNTKNAKRPPPALPKRVARKPKPTAPEPTATPLATSPYALPAGHVLVLRCCDANRKSHNGRFQWPSSGLVEAPDWRDNKECGNGLHGWLWGEGDIGCAGDTAHDASAIWLVVEVLETDIRDLVGKVKHPRGWVVCCGSVVEATDFVRANGGLGRAIIRGTSTSGDGGTSTSGDGGTSTSGDGGTSTSGDGGTSTSGDGGTSTSGDGGTSTSGDGGTSTSGDGGTSTSGDGGTSTSGDGGTSTSGDGGTSTSGDGGTVQAGEDGALQLELWDPAAGRYRRKLALVGENDIEPNVPYRLDAAGKFVRAPSAKKKP